MSKVSKRAALELVVGKLKEGRLTRDEAQLVLDAFGTFVEKRWKGDQWDEVLSLEMSLFGKALIEKGEAV